MASKKNRPARSSAGVESTADPTPAVTSVAPAAPRGGVPLPTSPAPAQPSVLERILVSTAAWLGSLHVAVISLSIFAVCVAIGTIIESWYSAKIAQELVYKAWWFTTLLALIWVNIFFAAAKKWPWKKYQTGFLITHLGLLTLVGGGILTSLAGTDALMVLVDTDRSEYRKYGAHATSKVVDNTTSSFTVRRPGARGKEETLRFPFEPGSLAWRADEHLTPRYDPLTSLLNWLAHPLPWVWQADLGGGATLEVLNFYPHARLENYRPADRDDRNPFPAVKLSLKSSVAGAIPDQWVAFFERDRSVHFGPGQIDFIGKDLAPVLVEEFRKPPDRKTLGQKGQLVLHLHGQTYRFSVDQTLDGAAQPIGTTPWKFKFNRYDPNFQSGHGSDGTPQPVLVFDITASDGKSVSLAMLGRLPGVFLPLPENRALLPDLGDLQVWYHAPDVRFGNDAVRAVLQFVTGSDGKLYYRSFHSSSLEGFQFERSGEAQKGPDEYPIWKGMNWQFTVKEFLPRAIDKPDYKPENARPGLEREDLHPVLRCRLSVGKEAKEFWVNKTDGSTTPVKVGNEEFAVGFNVHTEDIGIELRLLRAEQTNDRGTQMAATYASYVQLTDKNAGIHGEDRFITMNEPLEHAGYKFYQSGYFSLGLDDAGKPVNRSVLTVGRDPGLIFKYAGSVMLALGIIIMFYMKAYFFKPRGQRAAA